MRKYTVVIEKEGKFHIAKCLELGITSQGRSHGVALDNIKEAIELFVKENPRAKTRPVTVVTIEV